MIRRVTVRNFKRFEEQTFELADSVVLAGPNNAGKSTLLQAIATWKMGMDRWAARRGAGSASSAVKRSGVSIARGDLTATPLRETNLLWRDRRVTRTTQEGTPPGTPRLIEIVLEGGADGGRGDPDGRGKPGRGTWECGLEFQYANPEMVYVRPRGAKKLDSDSIRRFPPRQAAALDVVHVPPLVGLHRDEPRLDKGMQDLLAGQGQTGGILRNLLLETAEKQSGDWDDLTGHVRDLFRIDLRKPTYSPAQPYIVCEYDEPRASGRPLDLANAGSGALQVILLLAFLYARPTSVILLNEPDAHQHVVLQKQVYGLLRKVARERGGQVVLATHSEVVLDATAPERVLSFFGREFRALATPTERDQLREALKRLTTTDLLLGQEVGAVLYVEYQSDERILKEWADTLDHPARRFLRRPFVRHLAGSNVKDAKNHFFALRAAFPEIRAACLLDGDNKSKPDVETTRAGMTVLRWRRYEIENYLLQPAAVGRFVGLAPHEDLVQQAFDRQVPVGTDYFGDHPALSRIKASHEFLLPLLEEVGTPTPKRDLYLLAATMKPHEIHAEVIEKLDHIADTLNPPDPGP